MSSSNIKKTSPSICVRVGRTENGAPVHHPQEPSTLHALVHVIPSPAQTPPCTALDSWTPAVGPRLQHPTSQSVVVRATVSPRGKTGETGDVQRPTTCKPSCALVNSSAAGDNAAGADSFNLAPVGRQKEGGVGKLTTDGESWSKGANYSFRTNLDWLALQTSP
jgi:hypothetical protein